MTRKITIDPITRLEGHGSISIFLDDNGKVDKAFFQIPELRGFEEMCKGRQIEEMPWITSRLCGVCPSAHHLAAAKAVDDVYSVEPPPAASRLRELMYMAHFCHSHLVHFYVLAAPDFVCGPDAPVAERNVLGVLAKVGKEIGSAVIDQRSKAQKAQELLAGRPTHMAWAIPGGVSKGLDANTRKTLERWGLKMKEFSLFSIELFRKLVLDNSEYVDMILSDPYAMSIHDMGLVDDNGMVNFYDGKVRVTSPTGDEVAHYHPSEYLDHIEEHVEKYTYLKFPFLKKKGWKGFVDGNDSGIYRATSLSRLNVARGMATPEANAAYAEFYKTLGGKPVHATLATHWARLIELLYAAERWCELVTHPDITSTHIHNIPEAEPSEGVGCIEAPRGTLTHHYTTDDKGIVTSMNLIVGTTNNHAPISMSVARAADAFINAGSEPTEGMLNRIEMAFRAYDPCMSCATHSLPGRMPMRVSIHDSSGALIRTVERSN